MPNTKLRPTTNTSGNGNATNRNSHLITFVYTGKLHHSVVTFVLNSILCSVAYARRRISDLNGWAF